MTADKCPRLFISHSVCYHNDLIRVFKEGLLIVTFTNNYRVSFKNTLTAAMHYHLAVSRN